MKKYVTISNSKSKVHTPQNASKLRIQVIILTENGRDTVVDVMNNDIINFQCNLVYAPQNVGKL